MGRIKRALNKKKSDKNVVSDNIKSLKFIGYCPKCNFIISQSDFISKYVFECHGCGKKGKKSILKKETGNNKPLSKKEYLENSVNADYYEMPALNDQEIDPKDFKIQDT